VKLDSDPKFRPPGTVHGGLDTSFIVVGAFWVMGFMALPTENSRGSGLGLRVVKDF